MSWPSRTGLVLLSVVLGVGLARPAAAQTFKWWQDEHFAKDLALTADQSARIEEIFRSALPPLRQSKGDLDRQEAELSRLIEGNVEEAQIVRQVDRVEAVRGGLSKTRTLMYLHMRQVLSPDQRAKFKALVDQFQAQNHQEHSTGSR